MKRWILIYLLVLALPLAAAEWQWSVKEGDGRAYLWIPPDCIKVRAVVVAQHNMLEESVLENPVFRRAVGKLGIAEMWVVPQVAKGSNIEEGSGPRLLELLEELAQESGYAELGKSPVIPIGHSACATVPWNFAATFPERTLAVLSVHGDAPQTKLTGNGRPRMNWGDKRIDGIPGLFAIGEFEWSDDRVQPGLDFRKMFPKSCIAMLAEPGQGHFAACDDLIEFLAMFIQKAAEARLPDKDGGPLKAVDPAKGWLVQRWRLRDGRNIPPAPVATYSGDPGDAFWAFDGEMANAIQNYQLEHLGKKPQLLGYVQQEKVVPQADIHQQVTLKFLPEEDGVSFALGTGFLSEVEAGSKNLARWTGLPVATPLGHATSETEIRRITGPFAVTGKNRFELRLNRTWVASDSRNNQLWFAAFNNGDGDYSPAVQQAMMTFAPNASGKPQVIRFQMSDVKSGTENISLGATSDTGSKVHYYVREGPAEVDGSLLTFTKIPPRASFPVKVTVVAWQWGNPQINTAAPVERTFSITQ